MPTLLDLFDLLNPSAPMFYAANQSCVSAFPTYLKHTHTVPLE